MKIYLVVLVALLVISCGGRERDFKLELDVEVSQRNICRGPTLCRVVNTGHPLGCAVAVSYNEVETIEILIDELKSEYIAVYGETMVEDVCPQFKPTCEEFQCGLEEIAIDDPLGI